MSRDTYDDIFNNSMVFGQGFETGYSSEFSREYNGSLGDERLAEYWREAPGQDGNYYRQLTPDEVSQVGPLSIQGFYPLPPEQPAPRFVMPDWNPTPAIQPIDPRDIERELERLQQLQREMTGLQPYPPLIIIPRRTITLDGTVSSMTVTSPPSTETPPVTYESIAEAYGEMSRLQRETEQQRRRTEDQLNDIVRRIMAGEITIPFPFSRTETEKSPPESIILNQRQLRDACD